MKQPAWRAVNAEEAGLRTAIRSALKHLKDVLDEPKVYVTLVQLYITHKKNVSPEDYRNMLRDEGLRKERRSEVYRIICAEKTAAAFVAGLGIRKALRAAREEKKRNPQGNSGSGGRKKCSIVPPKPIESMVRMLDRLTELFRQKPGQSPGEPGNLVPPPISLLECGIYLVRFTPSPRRHTSQSQCS